MFTRSDTELASKILTALGIKQAESMEPTADFRRDSVARVIAAHEHRNGFHGLDLTDDECDQFRRMPGSFNDMVRAIFKSGARRQAEIQSQSKGDAS